ncbi:hypothetical protein SUGI_0121070 [Cryptomeria japonica]|nr:hypothetical protein SUGI_0121070 [Cryptomeria japonica]
MTNKNPGPFKLNLEAKPHEAVNQSMKQMRTKYENRMQGKKKKQKVKQDVYSTNPFATLANQEVEEMDNDENT